MRSAKGLPFLLREGMAVALVPPVSDAPRQVTVESVSLKSDTEATVLFAEVKDADIAHRLVGCHCLVRRDLFDPAEIVSADSARWEGWEVRDVDGTTIGSVEDVDLERLQPLLAVRRPDGSEALIPLIDEFIVCVDEDLRRIDVDLPSGLLDL